MSSSSSVQIEVIEEAELEREEVERRELERKEREQEQEKRNMERMEQQRQEQQERAQQQEPINPVLEKFRHIEHNFNKNFLTFLYQIMQIPEGEENDRDIEQFSLLQAAYKHWYEKLQEDPRCMDACLLLHDAVKENHELLLHRDTQIFTLDGDFFSNMFEQKGLDTAYLFDQLQDGLEEEEETTEPSQDAKDNLWSTLIGLYRLCVLICIYLKMPLVKEIIDMILMSNPDLNQHNIFEKIFQEFKGKRRLRKMIMKLLKSKGDNFGDIFNSLQKVIATFGPEVNLDSQMKNNVNLAQQKVQEMFVKILEEAGVEEKDPAVIQRLISTLEDKKDLSTFVTEGVLTETQAEKIMSLYKSQGLERMNVTKVVRDLGQTMESMMSAIQSNDEEAVKKVLANAGSGLNLNTEELERMQAEMDVYEKEEEKDLSEDEEEDEELD